MNKPVRTIVQSVLVIVLAAASILLLFYSPLTVPLSMMILAIITWPLVETLRRWELWSMTPFNPTVSSAAVANGSSTEAVGVVVRKSLWWAVPMFWVILSPDVGLRYLFSVPVSSSWIAHLIVVFLLSAFLGLFIADAVSNRTPAKVLVSGMLKSFVAAGFPEDVLIVGFLGGSVFRQLASSMAPIWAMLLTIVVVEVAFSASHFPEVLRNRRFYAENMTGKSDMSLWRSLLQMTLFSVPSWIFLFVTGSVWYAIAMHTLADLSAFLPRDTSQVESE